jgi:beta-glucosidase
MIARGELNAGAALPNDNFSVRWTGQLLPPVSGRYELTVGANDGMRLFIDGKKVLDAWAKTDRIQSQSVTIDLEAGKRYAIKLEYFEDTRDAEVRLSWAMPGAKSTYDEALSIAQSADVIVFVGGLTGDVEGEEMKVIYPGFAGGDRTDIRLPHIQQVLLEKLHATGKPVVLVLTGGSALAVDWAQQNLPAILLAWYPGQRGGDAVADALFGKINPAGRLPITFYKGDEKLPAFDDYSMKNRTYRYFTGEALYPFGYGLSYTQFTYSALKVSDKKIAADKLVDVSVTVKNTGKLAGDEVVQLYVTPLKPAHARAQKELRGVERVHLQAGETREVKFSVKPDKDFTIYDADKKAYVVDSGKYQLQVGASSTDIRLRKDVDVK